MGAVYFSETGKFSLNGDGGGIVNTSDPDITGRWDKMNYISQPDYDDFILSYEDLIKIKKGERDMVSLLNELEILLDKDPFDEKGGRVLGKKMIREGLDMVPQVFKSDKIIKRDPDFPEPLIILTPANKE